MTAADSARTAQKGQTSVFSDLQKTAPPRSLTVGPLVRHGVKAAVQLAHGDGLGVDDLVLDGVLRHRRRRLGRLADQSQGVRQNLPTRRDGGRGGETREIWLKQERGEEQLIN